jgi:hypothetical protein
LPHKKEKEKKKPARIFHEGLSGIHGHQVSRFVFVAFFLLLYGVLRGHESGALSLAPAPDWIMNHCGRIRVVRQRVIRAGFREQNVSNMLECDGIRPTPGLSFSWAATQGMSIGRQ